MNGGASFDWSDANVERLKKWWRDGLSASRISVLFGVGGPTRNAVIGKVYRLGLTDDRSAAPFTPRAPKPKRSGSILRPPRRIEITPQPTLEVVQPRERFQPDGRLGGAPTPLMLSVTQLSDHTCKWPIGTPGAEGFGFCGNRSAEGRVYCGFHCAKAYEPPKKNAKTHELVRSLRRYA